MMIDNIGGDIDFNWRLLANGYLPENFHEKGSVANDISVEELREKSPISYKAKEFGLGEGYSEAVLERIPKPATPIRPWLPLDAYMSSIPVRVLSFSRSSKKSFITSDLSSISIC